MKRSSRTQTQSMGRAALAIVLSLSLFAACSSASDSSLPAPADTPLSTERHFPKIKGHIVDGGTSSDASTDTGAVSEASADTGAVSEASTDAGAVSEASTDAGVVSEASAEASPATDGSVPYLHAMGSTLVDGSGNAVRLHGVNRAGLEYACIQGWGFFDGPSDDNSLAAIASWKSNSVRILLNEDCWLGINGVPAQYGGTNYQQVVSDFADRIWAHGMYPVVTLHHSAPGTTPATGQSPMPDMDHTVTFWSQVAAMFAARPNVVLELFNEPYPDNNQDTTAAWTCWRDGGTCSGVSYQAAGMATLLNAVRQAGANNLVLLGGVEYSNALSQFASYVPSDPAKNVGAAWHVYNFNTCNNTTCYNGTVAPVATQYPIVATEIGEDDCGGSFITTLMGWLDSKQQSYMAWTWDTWGNCLDLISDYSGTPTSPYGTTFKNHLAGL